MAERFGPVGQPGARARALEETQILTGMPRSAMRALAWATVYSP